VIGGSVSPRGQDKFRSGRQTHSPTTFIPDIGKAYRASGRTKPIMDMFAFHPYGDNSSQAPKFAHPRSTSIGLADYGKLVGLLRRAFAGTAQRGGSLPIVYDEYGIDSVIPASKTAAYSGSEPAATRPVHESLQGSRYREAIRMAACQPNVRILLIFHVSDEPDLGRWQSGMYYADDTPKTSLDAVRVAMEESRRGVVAQCDDALRLVVHPKVVQRGAVLRLTCDLDCTYVAQLYRLPGHLIVSKRGRAVGGKPTALPLRAPKTKRSYRLRLSAIAAVNPGKAATLLLNVRRG